LQPETIEDYYNLKHVAFILVAGGRGETNFEAGRGRMNAAKNAFTGDDKQDSVIGRKATTELQ